MTINRGETRNGIIAAKTLGRELRKKQTKPEEVFWRMVRNRRLLGLKFYRQHPVFFKMMGRPKYYIADFYCHEKNLVIEIDGKIHANQKDYDRFRDFIINALGITVLRIKNEEIEKDLKAVMQKIKDVVTHPESLSFEERDFIAPFSSQEKEERGVSSRKQPKHKL